MDKKSKALRVADILADKLAGGFITSRQLAVLCQRFPQGHCWIYDHAPDSKLKAGGQTFRNRAETPSGGSREKLFHRFGTYRTEIVIALTPNIVDICNFDVSILILVCCCYWLLCSVLTFSTLFDLFLLHRL